MKTPKLPLVPIALGQLALFSILLISVQQTRPHFPTTPQEIERRLKDLDSEFYFIQGESLSKQKFAVPSARWSQCFLDPDSFCRELGNGVWQAKGSFEISVANNAIIRGPWEILFLPKTNTPLFIKVGDREFGSYEAASLKATSQASSQKIR